MNRVITVVRWDKVVFLLVLVMIVALMLNIVSSRIDAVVEKMETVQEGNERLQSKSDKIGNAISVVEVNVEELKETVAVIEVKVNNLEESLGNTLVTANSERKTVGVAEIQDVAIPTDLTLIGDFKATAYDLGIPSCGKPLDHPEYGITKSGKSLKGLSREEAMSVAVDPSVIPLGTTLYIEFEEAYAHYNGVYTAVDVGGAIKENKIDIFVGDFNSEESSKEALDFGKRNAVVYKVNE